MWFCVHFFSIAPLGEITEFERIYKEMKANADTAV